MTRRSRSQFRQQGESAEAYLISITRIAAGPRMTTNSTGRKNRIIGTVSFGGSAAAFFSASCIRMSRFSCAIRSEEHTSELQSPCNLVCRLLLEKKKQHRRASLEPPILRATGRVEREHICVLQDYQR